MTTRARELWLPPISLVVVVLLVAVISFSSVRISPWVVTGQAVLLVIALRFFCYWPPMVRWMARMPLPHRAIFAVLIASIIIGHYTLDSRTYFPYVAWEIFPLVNERDPVTCPEFLATTSSGKKVRLLVEQLFPSIVQLDPLDDPRYFSPEKRDHLARALTHAYDQRHAGDPVRELDLVAVSVHLHPRAGESSDEPSCQLLKHYDFSSVP